MLQNDNHSTPLRIFLYSAIHFSTINEYTRITTYANRIIELEILITINQFIISCLSLFGNICMAGIRMISITKNEAICRGRGLRKNGQYYFVLLYLHDSNPVNRGKPQCNSEMVQSRDIWIVFSISGNYAYIPLCIQANIVDKAN